MGNCYWNLFINFDCYSYFTQYENQKSQKGVRRINIQVDIESLENKAFISAYGKNYVIVDKKKYHNLLFFYNDQIKIINKNLDVFDQTILKHLYFTLKTTKFDIILFGTGKNLQKIPEKLKKYLIEKKYNFEIMSTYSAFNTHNILLSENRNLVSLIKLI